MKPPRVFTFGKVFLLGLLFGGLVTQSARADWQRDETSLSWRDGTNVVWRFSFDSKKGKTYFDPVSVRGTTFTNFKPEDHPWHYGLWFSWKYINHANYWEEDRKTGKAEGITTWKTPTIETMPDGSALIKLEVTYTNPNGQVDMTESRDLKISSPKADGGYAIDWRADFKAGKEGAVLDRTPMPGDPGGQVNGGYAGLGLRMAGPPLGFSVLCSTGLVNQFVSDRARPAAPAIAFNFAEGASEVSDRVRSAAPATAFDFAGGKHIGGIAIFSDPINAGEKASWYVVNSKDMRFACAAILAPKIRTLKADEEMKLHYRIAVSPKAWTVELLQSVAKQ